MFRLKIFIPIVLMELISLFFFLYPETGWPTFVFILLCLLVFAIALFDLRYGVLIALIELFIGGLGYFFALPAGGLNLSARMGLFLVLTAAAAIKIIREKKIEFLKSKFFLVYCFLIFFVIIGLVNGYWRGHNPAYIFFDVNAFFFLAYLFIFYQAFKNAADLKLIWPVFWSATIWLAFKTLVVFFIFTHGFASVIPDLYKWIRDTGVGEITPATGGFYRIFFQSQIYLVLGLLLFLAEYVLRGGQYLFFWTRSCPAPPVPAQKNKYCPPPRFAVFLFSAVLLSFSRSFWVGLSVGLILTLLAAFVFLRVTGRQILKSTVGLGVVFLSGFLLALLVSYFPYPSRPEFSLAEILGERISKSDAAAATRWAELEPLWSEIKKNWFLGAGFGAAVTFKTQDPRILSVSQSGAYTTYAFEWGWLDLWLKIGLVGLIAYLYLLLKIFKSGWLKVKHLLLEKPRSETLSLNFGLVISLIALSMIHIFTPYLNHPLGLGWLMLAGLIIEKTDNV